MKPRAVGGYEPDDEEQAELVELWHLSRTAAVDRAMIGDVQFATPKESREWRREWTINRFLEKHHGKPNVARKWIYVWVVDNIGHLTTRPA